MRKRKTKRAKSNCKQSRSLPGRSPGGKSAPLEFSRFSCGMSAMIPIPAKSRLKEAIQSLARLSEATGRMDQAGEWKEKGSGHFVKRFTTLSALSGGGPCLGSRAARQEEAGDAIIYLAEGHLNE